jgi:hypothetical protein
VIAVRRAAPRPAGAAAVWLSALLLLALVVVAGLPDASASTATPQRIERCEGARIAVALAAVDDAAHARGDVRVAAARAARPRPRTRDGQRRGLPPCRAPTC